MIEQQRQQLAMMGIDVWIPRHAAVRSISTRTTLWRDVADEPSVNLPISQTEPLRQTHQDRITQHVPEVDLTHRHSAVEPQPKIQQQKTTIQPTVTPAIIPPAQAVQAFQLQALVADQFVILTDHAALSPETLQLWRNIQQALSLLDASLQWPLPLANLQDSAALGDYVQGFFDVIAAEKAIFCLGDLPIELKLAHQRVASLAEMLQQPLLKQQLWTLIQQKL